MNLYAVIVLTSALILCGGCATKDTAKGNEVSPRPTAQLVAVVAQAKYYLDEVPPRLFSAEIIGDEGAVGAYDNTNLDGVILEIIKPKEYAGKIYTLRGAYPPHQVNRRFALGGLYKFRASVRNIGKFSFEEPETIPVRRLPTEEAKKQLQEHTGPRLDDLEWLVGRWRCITREWLVSHDGPLGSGSEDALDYFNVYFPYADDHLTLELTDNPDDRPIAAEFLVRAVRAWGDEPFNDELLPMMDSGPVRISKDRILVGSPFEGVEFHYSRGEGRWGPLLVLESKFMRLEFYKLPAPMLDIEKSFVHAPIKDYTSEQIAALKRRYERLRASLSDSTTTK